ncbi:MarR family transcriptional regulator [Psychrilyobacter atlanticus]|uniref:MarR family transcriptional regulator n=1 Tax=Psychrilyobacter atlanticus TaxID=271091 RepID=UPI0003F80429|nr:helix-turn-helix domain-containing protein [Psychrilyobacter atlanticus]
MENKEIIIDVLTVANILSMAGKELLCNVVENYNVNQNEYYLLRYLEKNPGEIQYNFLKFTTLTKSRINQIVSKLEKMGYLEKKSEMTGGLLKKPLYLTKLGEMVVKEGVEKIYDNTIKNFNEKEIFQYETYRNEMVEILTNMKLIFGIRTPKYLEEK